MKPDLKSFFGSIYESLYTCNDHSFWDHYLEIDNALVNAKDPNLFPEVRCRIDEMDTEDICKLLTMKRVSLEEGLHLILGIKQTKHRYELLVKPVSKIYKDALKDISTRALAADVVYQNLDDYITKGKQDRQNIYDPVSIDEEQGILVRIPMLQLRNAYYFNPAALILWALQNGHKISKRLCRILRLKFHDPWYREPNGEYVDPIGGPWTELCNKISKPHQCRIQLQATAQALWFINPNLSYFQIRHHNAVKDIIPKGKYPDRDKSTVANAFASTLRSVSPKHNQGLNHVPGVIVIDDEGEKINFFKLKLVTTTIAKTLRLISPQLRFAEIKSHKLLKHYTQQCHPIVSCIMDDWIYDSTS